ncbi:MULTISPECIES: type II and III secretion system protein family protein [Rhizobiaceae]|uniref:Pilus assembly protein CpaC n=1 Tax=Aliirhizobium cellulosilyticum TaxID=393664 RepID=A0A7W6TG97_9HYPH|nr:MULTISPECIES: type II and III secretion system protein family protein [Rhizobium/Agrobacterium group]MBB4349017.1 pilus assembly protein CpaC [Rhizobium cellulosilyticum]MBB4412762.1 pilus assembly protein CpaC [Rhizobium cellulosilyticum]MBB4447394.1 pilus assembly protein CpaC [Rhizobium cellulosilyticum]MBO0140964.1 type II and III secretion system protein family protein [Agrobacterium sp. Ap1]
MILKRKTRATVSTGLAFCLAFSGIPGSFAPSFLTVPSASAADSGVIRIAQGGVGIKRRLTIGLNKALVIDLPSDAHDILVADPSMADAVTRTSRRIYLFGKTVGQTNIFVFGPGGEEIVTLDVEIERDISGLEANLRRFLPDSNIKVEIVSDNIVLSGSVRTPQDSAKAAQLANAFLKGGEATTREITATSGNNGGDSAIYAEGRQTSTVVNLLSIEGEDQVTLKITVAEIRREVLKQLGFDNTFTRTTPSRNALDVLTVEAGTQGLNGTIAGQIGKLGIETALSALEQADAIRTLAEPTLTAISGQAATFNSGGERLYSTTGVDGVTTVTPYQYGISLAFTPTVLSSGRISLRIQTRVSEPVLTTSAAEYRKRDAETTVELPSGGSLALAGLIRDDISQSMKGTPVASKVPLVGALFRAKTYERNETELVIIATPYLVRPVNRNELSRPDDNFQPASDAESVFLGRVNKIYGRKEASPPPAPYQGNVGFIYK